jgi:hypothetical protein
MSFLLSIPAAMPFSRQNILTHERPSGVMRNRMSLVLATTELQVYRNYTFYCCSFFYKFALQNRKLLEAAGSNDKYGAWFVHTVQLQLHVLIQ